MDFLRAVAFLLPLAICTVSTGCRMDEIQQGSEVASGVGGRVNTDPETYSTRVLTLSYQCRLTADASCDSVIKEATQEGSGVWGAKNNEKKPTDHVAHAVFSRVADAADTGPKYHLAAAHLRYYLGNSGVTRFLTNEEIALVGKSRSYKRLLKASQMMVRTNVNHQVAAEASSLTVGKTGVVRWAMGSYFEPDDKDDLFFAIGGHHVVFVATYRVTAVRGDDIEVSTSLVGILKDNYNWDAGKAISVLDSWCKGDWCTKAQGYTSLTITDRDLGRLHKVGLAKEFQVRGLMPATLYKWNLKRSTLPTMKPVWEKMLRCHETKKDFYACES